MNTRLFLFVSLFVTLLSACKNNDVSDPVTPTADFNISFDAQYDGSRLVKYQKLVYNNYPLELTRFALFLSDVTLLKSNGEQVLTESAYLNFTPDTAVSDVSAILKYTFKNVPEGDYTGIKIGYGVKPSDNAKNPADFPPTSPLYNEIEYWLGWKSYIFCKIEGEGDKDSNGQFDHFLVYHCGGSGVYKTFTFNQPIHVHAGDPGLKVSFDLKKLFIMDDGRYYNLVTNPVTSNNKDSLRVANDIMSKFGKATSIVQ
ncbi:MAG: MbnP family protein [Bacteroidota bacterium]